MHNALLLVLAQGLLTVAPGDEFVMSVPGQSITARMDGKDITGPQHQFAFYGDALRGRAYNRAADLTEDGDRVSGSITGGPINLHVKPTAKGLHVTGLYAGQISNIRLGPDSIEGNFGACSYDLHAQGAEYVGFRSCGGGPPQPTSVQIPSVLAERSPTQLVAALAMLMSG